MRSRELISRAGWLVFKPVDTGWFGYLSLHAYLCYHAIFHSVVCVLLITRFHAVSLYLYGGPLLTVL